MSTVTNLETLTGSAEYLLRLVTEEEEEVRPDLLSSSLETVKTVSLCMTGDDSELASLTIRSIILKCLNIPEGGELERTKVIILSSLVQLYTDLNTAGEKLTGLVCASLQQSRVNTSSWLSLVCALSDDIFLHHQDLVRDTFFWQQVQAGLVSADHLARKRALYLTKRSVDLLTGDGRSESEALELIGPSKKEARDNFETYFLVLETLEEKQVHIVKQVTQKIQHLVRLSSAEDKSSFHSSWSLILFLRMFQHPNMSMVCWGLQLFLQTRFSQKTLRDENFLSFLCNPFLDVLNETRVYSRDQLTGETIARLLAEFLTDCQKRLDQEAGAVMMRTLVTAISSRSWGPIPLTWTSFGLKYLDLQSLSSRYLTENELGEIQALVETGLQYQEPLLRAASQTNFCLFAINSLNPQECSFNQLATFLHTFLKKKVLFLSDSSKLWKKVAQFVCEEFLNNDFQSVFSCAKERFENLRKNTSEATKVIAAAVDETNLMLVLFLYHQNFDPELISKIRNNLFVQTDPTRVYEGERFKYNDEQWSRVEVLQFLSLYRMFQPPRRREGKPYLHFRDGGKPEVRRTFAEVFGYSPSEMWSAAKQATVSLQVLLDIDSDMEDIGRSEIYTDLLTIVLNSGNGENVDPNYVLEFLDRVLGSLNSSCRVKRMVVMKTLAMFSRLEHDNTLRRSVCTRLAPHFRTEGLTQSLLTESQREKEIINREDQKIWGTLSGEYTALQLQILKFLISNSSLQEELDKEQMSEVLTETLETGGRECLIACLDLAETLQLNSEVFLRTSRNIIFEFRKNEVFWPSLSLLIRLCLRNILTSPDTVTEILLQLISESETVGGIFPLLMVELEKFSQTETGAGELVVPVIARGLTYGPGYRKDQRLVTETSEAVFELGEDCEANTVEGSDHLMDESVRINAIKTIFNLLDNLDQDEKSSFLFGLFEELQSINSEVTGKRVRHFENSNIHKVRQRLYQNYLIFSSLLNRDHKRTVMKEICSTLLAHNEQTSVRYYCEWTVSVLLLSQQEDDLTDVWQWLERAAEEKVGSVPSFLMIITQYLWCRQSVSSAELERGLRGLSPWCMAQNFYTRIVAQVCFRKVWTKCEASSPDLVEKYFPLFDCISRSVNPANAEKLYEDFYITKLDPVSNLTLEDILYNFPRLCNSSEDEVISPTLLASVPVCHLPIRNPNSLLASHIKEKVNADENSFDSGDGQNIQKKITPWTSMLSDSDIGVSSRQRKDQARAHQDLIVVASLIDKAPNLGGLCRTCEILGVGSLVLPSKAVVKDKEFSAVSVTSENWLPLEECQSYKLAEYLQEKKKEGFTIVAVEQTAESVLLNDYKFPKKCVFLLGKEKEGVPVELLNQVDVCIEIPQFGLIRDNFR